MAPADSVEGVGVDGAKARGSRAREKKTERECQGETQRKVEVGNGKKKRGRDSKRG